MKTIGRLAFVFVLVIVALLAINNTSNAEQPIFPAPAQTVFHAFVNHDKLYDSIMQGDVAAVKRYLDLGGSPDYPLPWGNCLDCFCTMIHIAAKQNQGEIISLLIDRGADIENKCAGHTPLYSAAMYSSLEAAEVLVQRGADVNAKAIFNWSVLVESISVDSKEKSSLQFVKFLISKNVYYETSWPILYWFDKMTPQLHEYLLSLGFKDRPGTEFINPGSGPDLWWQPYSYRFVHYGLFITFKWDNSPPEPMTLNYVCLSGDWTYYSSDTMKYLREKFIEKDGEPILADNPDTGKKEAIPTPPDRINASNLVGIANSVYRSVMERDSEFISALKKEARALNLKYPGVVERFGNFLLDLIWTTDFDAQLITIQETSVDNVKKVIIKGPHSPERNSWGRLSNKGCNGITEADTEQLWWSHEIENSCKARWGRMYKCPMHFFAKKEYEGWSSIRKMLYRGGPIFAARAERLILQIYAENNITAPAKPNSK
jgi:hypothetical protein